MSGMSTSAAAEKTCASCGRSFGPKALGGHRRHCMNWNDEERAAGEGVGGRQKVGAAGAAKDKSKSTLGAAAQQPQPTTTPLQPQQQPATRQYQAYLLGQPPKEWVEVRQRCCSSPLVAARCPLSLLCSRCCARC